MFLQVLGFIMLIIVIGYVTAVWFFLGIVSIVCGVFNDRSVWWQKIIVLLVGIVIGYGWYKVFLNSPIHFSVG